MNLADLLDEFNIVIDTAEGLTELRSLILGLAVRGKLVSQDPNDEPASELLKKIEAEKKRLYKEDEIRKPKKLKNVSDEEAPFEIPKNWIWTRLGKTANDVHYGYTESADFEISEPKFLRITDIQDGKVDWKNTPGCTIEEDEIPKYQLHNGDLLIARTGGTVGKSFLINDVEYSAVFASYLIRFIPTFTDTSEYIYKYLYTKLYWDQLYESTSGTGQPNVNATKLSNLLFPLPPLAEQHRIVQKIESLFAEVDVLEEKLNRQTKLDEKLQQAVNAEVQQAPDAGSSKSAWNFITSNFDTLYHTPEAIDNLKKNILNEAVRGRLVPQNPNDEPASELLKKIKAEKQRLYDEGEIRKPKDLPPVKEDEIPFEIPESWEWCRLGDSILDIYGGSTPSKSNPQYWNGEYYWASVKDLNDDQIYIDKTIDTITELAISKNKTKLVPADNVIVCTRMGLGKINLNTVDVSINQDLKALILPKSVSHLFFFYVYKTMEIIGSGMTVSGIRQDELLKIPFQFPPLEEQHRIVQRIEELFDICDRFKAQLEQRQGVNERLVKGLVGEVLEGN
ncbi:restriction endonuclease subunit S [Gracilimonas amylolytica]|uniref:restriction endonuclease subunit S n=1 Tax=Gracilimonas amylolytica TaxID=1749045 RepID=UPI000CD8A575|nr:restriction endonuclease subunit S [Gracilimonas amylolytica]